MCTRVLWTGSGHGVLVGRNMDWHEDMPTNLWVLPRGLARTGLADDPHPLTWTSRYGSLVAAAWDIAGSDGVNEAGLAGHVLWLAEADFGPRDTTRPGLTAALWLQYLLDRYDSVAAVVAGLAAEPVQVQAVSARGEVSTIHLALDDASGDSAVLEYVGGELRVHHDRAYTVMTNSPPFDEQLDHLRRYDGFGGDEPIPGTTAAADRFVRAAYYSGRLPATDTSTGPTRRCCRSCETLPSRSASPIPVIRRSPRRCGARSSISPRAATDSNPRSVPTSSGCGRATSTTPGACGSTCRSTGWSAM
ncbi:linear amide C-N hydrolase [Nocardia thailandica]